MRVAVEGAAPVGSSFTRVYVHAFPAPAPPARSICRPRKPGHLGERQFPVPFSLGGAASAVAKTRGDLAASSSPNEDAAAAPPRLLLQRRGTDGDLIGMRLLGECNHLIESLSDLVRFIGVDAELQVRPDCGYHICEVSRPLSTAIHLVDDGGEATGRRAFATEFSHPKKVRMRFVSQPDDGQESSSSS